MKSKALLTAVLLAATNFAWASGGISGGQVWNGKTFVDPHSSVQTSSRMLDNGQAYNGKNFVGPASSDQSSSGQS